MMLRKIGILEHFGFGIPDWEHKHHWLGFSIPFSSLSSKGESALMNEYAQQPCCNGKRETRRSQAGANLGAAIHQDVAHLTVGLEIKGLSGSLSHAS